MPLEHIIACVDNSAYGVNEDVYPSRLLAQVDLLNELYRKVLDDNYESTFGILTIGDNRPTLRCSLTKESYQIGRVLNSIESKGTTHFVKGLYMAELALKHSTNENGDKHIICFVASPLNLKEEDIYILGSQFSKSPYRVDIISCGEVEQNSKLLHDFIHMVNAGKPLAQQSTLTEVYPQDTFEVVVRNIPSMSPVNDFGEDMDPDLLAAIEASKQSYFEQTGTVLDQNAITNSTIAPPTEPVSQESHTENSSAPVESVNQNESSKFYSLDLDPEIVEFCKEAFGDPNFDPKHIPEDIYKQGIEAGLFPPQEN